MDNSTFQRLMLDFHESTFQRRNYGVVIRNRRANVGDSSVKCQKQEQVGNLQQPPFSICNLCLPRSYLVPMHFTPPVPSAFRTNPTVTDHNPPSNNAAIQSCFQNKEVGSGHGELLPVYTIPVFFAIN